MNQFELTADVRTQMGSGAVRRLRREGRVPAVLYGAGKEPVHISVEQSMLHRQLQHEAFFSHILTVNVDGRSEQAVLKDVQRQPGTFKLLHLDLQRVVATEEIDMEVPLHFVHEERSAGKRAGANFSHHFNEVEIRCLPKDLPEYIEVDVSSMGVGDALYLSDLKLPQGATLVAFSHGAEEEQDEVVVSCYRPQEMDLGEEAEAAEAAEGGVAVPTVGEGEAPEAEEGEEEDKD